MKKFTVLLLMLFALSSFLNATTFTSAGSGDWSDGTTWDQGSVPGSNDDVVILPGHTIALDQDDKVRNLTIQSGGELIGNKKIELKDDLLVYGYMEVKEIIKADNIEVAVGGTLKVTDKIAEIKDDLVVYGYMEVGKIEKVDNINVAAGATLKVTDKLEEVKNTLTVSGLMEVKEIADVKHIDVKLGGTLTITDAGKELEIQKNGTLNVSGTLNVGKLKINDKATSVTIDGTLTVSDKLTNKKVSITGLGEVSANEYKDFNGNPGSLFGDGNPTNGVTYYGAPHWKEGLSSTDWNLSANWETGNVPSATISAVIRNTTGSSPIISTTGNNAKSLIIESGSLTIEAGAELTVAEDVINTVGNAGLIIQSDNTGSGSLIFASGTPAATVQCYVDAGAWHQVSSATDATNTSDFYETGNDSWLVNHTESTNAWTYIINTDSALSQNQGFDYWVTTARTVAFTGNLTATDQSPSLAYSGSASTQGWNLLGNPFSSAIDWDAGSWGTNISGTVYIWDAAFNGGDYRTWNGATGDLTDGIIPSGQGFFVQATSAGSFTIPEAARIHSAQSFYKSANDSEPTQYVRIQLDGNGYGNTVYVGFPENGTDGFDYKGDATKLYSSTESPQIFVVENEKELCINANAPLTVNGKTVPLYLVQVIEGDYTLTISDLEQLPGAAVLLEDLKTGVTHDFNQSAQYSFTASPDDNPARFNLHFTGTPNGIGDDYEMGSGINIYASQKTVYIRSTDEVANQPGMVYVYDLMGRMIAQKDLQKGELIQLTVNLNNSYAIVKVVKEGKIKTGKVFIK
ncbi:MAG: G8 domain-containing protein [Bacteroidales bacterium]|nr:G8 domain-containing protein [Bacteroidales bacterium]